MRFVLLLLSLLLSTSLGFTAFVHGDIYTSDFQKLNRTLIKIEGSFSYQIVTDKANYSIYLPPGNFTISASNFDEKGNLELYIQQTVRVGDEDQKVDLVLNPASSYDWLVYLFVLAIVATVFVWANRFWGKNAIGMNRQKREETEVQAQPINHSLDEDARAVLSALVGFEGRANQKDLKEALGFSDAKLSLIISELEKFGYVKKFKRGRGNIIKKLEITS